MNERILELAIQLLLVHEEEVIRRSGHLGAGNSAVEFFGLIRELESRPRREEVIQEG